MYSVARERSHDRERNDHLSNSRKEYRVMRRLCVKLGDSNESLALRGIDRAQWLRIVASELLRGHLPGGKWERDHEVVYPIPTPLPTRTAACNDRRRITLTYQAER